MEDGWVKVRDMEKEEDKRYEEFLRMYSIGGSVRESCVGSGLSRGEHEGRLLVDMEYGRRFRGAGADYADLLEEELHRRAVRGDMKRGSKSDTLLMFALKMRRPEYRDRVGGVVEGGVGMDVRRVSMGLSRVMRSMGSKGLRLGNPVIDLLGHIGVEEEEGEVGIKEEAVNMPLIGSGVLKKPRMVVRGRGRSVKVRSKSDG